MTTQLESWTLTDTDHRQGEGIGGVPNPIFFDIDPVTLGHLPVLGGGAFDLQRLRFALGGVLLLPPTLGPHVCRRKLAADRTAAKAAGEAETTTKAGRKVSLGPRCVDNVDIRQTTRGLYGEVQRKESRDESVLSHARRPNSRLQKSSEPRRGQPPGRSSRAEYTDVGRREVGTNGARKGPKK